MDDQNSGAAEFKRLRAEGEGHQIEKVGLELRKMFTWNTNNDTDYVEGHAAR